VSASERGPTDAVAAPALAAAARCARMLFAPRVRSHFLWLWRICGQVIYYTREFIAEIDCFNNATKLWSLTKTKEQYS